jgi:hypothetical protein
MSLRAEGDAAVAAVASWWPAGWDDYRPEGEPDRSVLTQKLIPMAEERAGRKLEEGAGRLPALEGVLYVTRAPSSVPPGALDSLGLGQGGVPEGAEGDEEEGEGEDEGVPQVPQV